MQDYDAWIQLKERGIKMEFLDEVLTEYEIDLPSDSVGRNIKKILKAESLILDKIDSDLHKEQFSKNVTNLLINKAFSKV